MQVQIFVFKLRFTTKIVFLNMFFGEWYIQHFIFDANSIWLLGSLGIETPGKVDFFCLVDVVFFMFKEIVIQGEFWAQSDKIQWRRIDLVTFGAFELWWTLGSTKERIRFWTEYISAVCHRILFFTLLYYCDKETAKYIGQSDNFVCEK